jgi:hypothetical protein
MHFRQQALRVEKEFSAENKFLKMSPISKRPSKFTSNSRFPTVELDRSVLRNDTFGEYVDDREESSEESEEYVEELCDICVDRPVATISAKTNLKKISEEGFQFSCGHLFCKDCSFFFVQVQMSDLASDTLKCPFHECKVAVSTNDLNVLFEDDTKTLTRYLKFVD